VDRRRSRWRRQWLGARGLIGEYAGWRWVFAINVPIVLLALVIAPRLLPADRKQTSTSRLDLGGALAATAGLALLVYGLTSAGDRGPAQLSSWLPLLLAAAAFVIFVRHERRTSDPLLPLELLRSRPVAGANLTALAITGSTTPAMYLSVLYVQDVLGVPAGRASLLFPAVNLAVIAGSLLGPRLLVRLGGRRTLLVGFTGIAMGITVLMVLPAEGLPVFLLLAAFTLIGAGLGAASVASTQTGTDAADPALSRCDVRRTQLRRPGRDSRRRRTFGTPLRSHRRPGRHDGLSHWFPGRLRDRAGRCPEQPPRAGASGL
jgi:predicted MFS family arabinose efflux permease